MSFKLILVIDCLSNPHAGTESQLLLLIQQLLARDVQVHLLVLSPSEWLANNSLPCPVTILGSSSIKNPLNWVKLWQVAWQLKRQGYKLAHIFFNDASVLCPPVFRLVGIKSIISRRDMGFWYNGLYKAILPVTGRCVDAVIANSRAVANTTLQVERIAPDKIRVIYNGYARASVGNEPVVALEQLKQSGATIIGVVANIRPIKRLLDAVSALGVLSNSYPELHLVIIGAGDPGELQGLAQSLGVLDNLHCMGSRADIPDCLRYFDIGLLCSESEGFSNAIVEYQFAGLPVICTDTGGNPEAIQEGVTGYLYPVADVEALVSALQRMLSDRDVAKLMGNEALRQAQRRYSVKVMMDNHMVLYRTLLERCK